MLKVHSLDDLDYLGEDPKRLLPGDRVGWFFNDKPHGIAISVNEIEKNALVLWTIPPRELPYIDDDGMFHTRIWFTPAKPIEWIQLDITVGDD